MVTNKIPKFQWGRNDGEVIGHGKDEWGKLKDMEKTNIIEVYDLKWNTDKENKCLTCGKDFEFIGSRFCSKNCYENYFFPKFT
ncbi:MAG TPA: hypothetical protein QF456_01470 [Nitrosopumilus sp.]|jgi:hypothetical protein|nr:hypothetical protein [Nitrosopumilus sp.]HJM79826.1 hypothetical protein [Nitrosopumilus sp.]